tara:strand:+ start:244 stop:690 length:447 start_codon:yes stop_codon:yes gene_type:complete
VKHTNQLHLFEEEKKEEEDSNGHVCIKCNTYKETSEFPFRETVGTSRRSICRDCTAIHTRVVKELKQQYPKPLDPNYSCPCCDKIEEELKEYGRWQDKSVWVLDHDHSTNTFRGWICNNCNNALGRFEDNTETLDRVITYLNKHKEKL